MTVLVDDQLLGALLRGVDLELEGPVHTSGLWYVRLCQAVVRARGGALSAPFADLPGPLAERAFDAVLELPSQIGLVSLRQLGPTMARLAGRHQLNLLAREALAAAVVLGATLTIASTNRSPRLVAAAEAEGMRVALVELS